MPEEHKAMTQPSAQSVDSQQRWRALNRALLVGLMIAALTSVSYLFLSFQMQAWQILAVAVGVAAGAVCILPARRRLRQNDLDGAGYWSLAAIVLAFGVSEMFWINNTLFAVAGALLLFLLVGSLVQPRRWGIWVAVAVAYGCFIIAVNQIQPLPRYDIAQAQLLNAFIPIVIGALLVALLWLIAREYLNFSLRIKLIVAFLVVSLVSVGAVALYADHAIRAALENQSASELINVAQLQGTTIGDLLAKEVELLQTESLNETIRQQAIASNAAYQGTTTDIQNSLLTLDRQWLAAVAANNDSEPLIRSRIGNSVAEHLREYRALYPENVEVFVTDRFGALLGATNRTSDYYQADEGWWQAAFNNGQGAIYYGQPDYDASSGKFSSDIAFPLYDRDGKTIIGVMRTTVDLATIVTLLANAHIGQTGRVDVLLPSKTYLEAQGVITASADLLAKLTAPLAGASEVIWEDGVPSFAAVAPIYSADPELGGTINQLNWQIIAHQSRAEVLAPVEAQAGAIPAVLALVVVIVIGSSVGLSQILVRPIVHLTDTAKKVSEGDLTAQATVETNDEIGTLAVTFNNMTNELRNVVSSLEERVQARTEQLRASAEVGRVAAAILDQDRLLLEIVTLITERLGFYYAAVFTLDETGHRAVLREATGEAGHTLKERGHQLEVNEKSMVGYAITQREARIALDVGADPVRFANPLLPDTHSEIALPLIVGNRALGALDVQSTEAAAFDDASAAVLQAMADQIAIALNNAVLFNQVERQVELQANINQLNRNLFAAASIEEFYQVMARMLNTLIAHDYLSVTLAHGTSTSLREYVLHADADPVLTEGPVCSPKNTLSGRAFTTRQPAVSRNLTQDANLDDAAQLAHLGFQSALSLPLIVGERVLGTLNFASLQAGAFLLERSAQLEQLAGQVAVALETQRLAQAQQNSLREMEALTRQLTGQAWAKRLSGQEAHVQYERSGLRTERPTQLPEIETAIEQHALIAWSKKDDPNSPSPYEATLATPILLRGEVLGALQVGEANHPREWSQDDITFIQAVADQVALALDNARLIEETQRRAQRERLVAEVSSRMFAANDLETIVQIAGEELGRVLRVDRAEIKIDPNLATAPLSKVTQLGGNGKTADWQA